jgi:type II secretion system protein L
MSEVRLRQALPSLVEERLLTDAADCHLAYRIESAEGNVMRGAVAAIDRVTLTRALEAVAESQLQPRSAYSALYSIPAPAGGRLSVRVHRGRGTVRTAEHSGFAFDVDDEPPAALSLAVQQLGILRIEAYGRDAARLLAFAPQLGVEVVDLGQDLDPTSTAVALNLLQGRYAPAGRFGMPAIASLLRSSQLKPVMTWAAGWLAIFVIGLNAYSWKLESEARGLKSSMQTAFRSAFPNESLVDTVAQTKIHVRQLRARAGQPSPDDFSVLNSQAAQLLAGAPVGALAGLEYRDAALTLKFKPGTASSSAVQDALRTQAAQQGLNLRFDGDGSARVIPGAP